jgi:two-component system sensor histidine kinase GlrK
LRISTRYTIGVALAVLPLLGVVTFSVDRMHELARSNERITTRRLVDARVGAEVITRLERLGEYRHKYAISSDPGYARKIDEIAASIDEQLELLASTELSASERIALERLRAAWEGFVAHGPSATIKPVERDASPEALVELAHGVQRSARERADLEATMARTLREQTGATALWVAALAIALSLGLIMLAVHSLRARLDNFIVGTRAVSKGEFSVQLDTSGDDELSQAALAFNRMVKNLEQLEQIKTDFIASVSHELRTPLVAMLETNLVLLDEVPGPLTSKQRTMLSLNTQAAQRLSNMISELLDLHRLRAGIRYDFLEHDLVELASAAVHELEAWASERSIRVRLQPVDESVTLACDRDRTVQVIQNLVENGLKYTPAGGEIEVWIRRCPTAALPDELDPRSEVSEHALLSVVDSGPGIPSEDRRRVFEKFFRRQGRSSDGGVGLGLALCREIVEAHAGTIAVGDSPLGGAAVHVALPIGGAAR